LVEERFAAMSETVDWLQIWGWLRLLPDALVRRRPGLLLAYANVDHWRGRLVSTGERLRAAIALLDAAGPTRSQEESALRAQADDLTALICFYEGDGAGVVEAARRALPHFPDRESFLGGSTRMMIGLGLHQQGDHAGALRILGAGTEGDATHTPTPRDMYTLAVIHLMAGELQAAQWWAELLLAQAERRDLTLLQGWANYLLGRVAYEVDDLAHARAYFVAAAAERRTNFFAISESLFGLALTEQALGDASQSERLLSDLDRLMAETGNDESRPRINTCQAHLALQRGDDAEAIRWLETAHADGSDILLYMVCPSLTAARVLLARGQSADLAAATTRLEAFRARAEREHATNWTIQARAVQALVARAQGDGATALDHLTAAIDLAAPGGFVRSFLDLGPPLTPLLRALAAQRLPSPCLSRLLAASEQAPVSPPVVERRTVTDPRFALLSVLTDREAEVLELLAHHLTNKEIAAVLSISPMTVKRHVSNILDKLGVGTRRQAIVQATALGLLRAHPR
jgi:LuxR family maltose regulon positive regulatory protein